MEVDVNLVHFLKAPLLMALTVYWTSKLQLLSVEQQTSGYSKYKEPSIT